MKLSKHIQYLIRVRDYETVKVEVGAELDHRDLGVSDNDLAFMHPTDRAKFIFRQHLALKDEVDKLARDELETIAGWSEISPNLAEDFLSQPVNLQQRKQHARNQQKADPPAASRRIRPRPKRNGSPSSPTAA